MPGTRLSWVIGKAAFVLPFFLTVLASPVSAAANEEELAPFTPWHVDWPKSSCLMRRTFGTADNPLLVQFQRSGPDDGFQLLLVGDRLRGWSPPKKLSIRYGQTGRLHELDSYAIDAASDGTPIVFVYGSSLASDPPKGEAYQPVTGAMEAAATGILLARGKQRILLKTGSLGPAFAELRRCSDQLAESWGIDMSKLRSASRRATPIGSPGNWITSRDYPMFAALRGRQAFINFRLVVGIDGRVTGCNVINLYPDREFDEITCQLLSQRARFSPALDSQGKPIADYYTNRVFWALP